MYTLYLLGAQKKKKKKKKKKKEDDFNVKNVS